MGFGRWLRRKALEWLSPIPFKGMVLRYSPQICGSLWCQILSIHHVSGQCGPIRAFKPSASVGVGHILGAQEEESSRTRHHCRTNNWTILLVLQWHDRSEFLCCVVPVPFFFIVSNYHISPTMQNSGLSACRGCYNGMDCLAAADLEILVDVEEKLKIENVKGRKHDWLEKEKNTCVSQSSNGIFTVSVERIWQ